MVRDYGGVERPRWRGGQRGLFIRHWTSQILLVGGFLVFASLPAAFALSGGFHSDRPDFNAKATGTPCRPITEAQFMRGWKQPPRRFQFGAADCSAREPGGPGPAFATCSFNAPFEVAVDFDGRKAWYDVGAGNSAVVDARRAGLTCRVTGRFDDKP
jgi:hypothetical protein